MIICLGQLSRSHGARLILSLGSVGSVSSDASSHEKKGKKRAGATMNVISVPMDYDPLGM